MTEKINALQKSYQSKNIVICLSLAVAALIIIIISFYVGNTSGGSLLKSLGDSLLVGGVLGFVFEVFLRRDILNMIFEMQQKIDTNKEWGDVSHSLGLSKILSSDRDLDYSEVIGRSINLTVIMNDGRTWFSQHEKYFEDRLRQPQLTTTIFLIHPESIYLESLSKKVGSTKEALIAKIDETISLLTRYHKAGHRLMIYGHHFPSSYSLVHTENVSCQITYPIARKIDHVPCFVFHRKDGDSECGYSIISRDLAEVQSKASVLFPLMLL